MSREFEIAAGGGILGALYLLYGIMRCLARIADELTAFRKGSKIPSLEELIEQEIESR